MLKLETIKKVNLIQISTIVSSLYFGIATFVICTCAASLYAITKFKVEMTRAFREVLINEHADLEETDVVVVEEGDQAVDEDAFEAEREHVDALEDDASQTTSVSVEEEKEKTEVLEDSNEKKCRIFSVFLDATAVYRIAFRVSWIPIICQFVNTLLHWQSSQVWLQVWNLNLLETGFLLF